jgi:hypothetical protein
MMRKFFDKAINSVRQYSLWDWGWLKITLFSFGLLIGVYFAQVLSQYMTFIWAIFIFAYIWIIYKTFVQYWTK